jgi:hypothetical protein
MSEIQELTNELAALTSDTWEEPSTDAWQSFGLVECYEPREPVKYIMGNIFEEGSLNIVYGAPGCFKSMLLADLCVAVSGGKEWLTPAPWQDGGRAIPTQKNPVVWVDFDNGKRRTMERFEALGHARELPDAPLYIFSMPLPWLQATNELAIASLALRIKNLGAKLVVIDNLGDILGDADENSADMAKVMSGFRQVAEDTGAAIVLIHHQRKSSGLNTRAGDSLRGHSSIEAALDCALLVDREAYADSVTITATKSRGADILPFRAHFAYDLKENTRELKTALFYGLGTEDNASSAAIRREILAALDGGSLNQKALIASVKEALPEVGIIRIRDEINQMATTDRLSVQTGKRTEKVYALPV